jgi:hypothetical protein
MPQIDPNAAEWLVVRLNPAAPDGLKHFGGDEEAKRYTLAEGRAIVEANGPPWRLLHFHTLVNPVEHQLWLNGAGARWAP